MPYAAHHRKERMRAYYAANKEKCDQQSLAWGAKQRLEVLSMLGGRCAHCGMADTDALAVDHIFGGGRQHRKQYPNQRTIFAMILRDKLTDSFQVLCHNCNWKKHLEAQRAKRKR